MDQTTTQRPAEAQLREHFEEHVFAKYFLSTITHVEGRVRGTGAFDLWPENCKTKDEFCKRGDDGHYVDDTLNAAWWGYLEATKQFRLELNDQSRDILGRICFQCVGIARVLRESGQPVKTRAEDEQAATIHFLLNKYLEHGDDWRAKADEELGRLVARIKANSPAAMAGTPT